MSKHKMVNGQLLQMNKTFNQLKIRQKDKIGNWMYEAYKRQVNEGLSDSDALNFVFDKIEEANIWIPSREITKRYRAKKKQFEKRHAREGIPKHLYQMEGILDTAVRKIDALEARIADYEAFQSEIKKLESYYSSKQWKDDFEADENGVYPKNLKRGILSEDGIYNMLERNKEMLKRIGSDNKDECLEHEE